MVKKGIALLLAVILVLGLAACGGTGENSGDDSTATTTTTASATTTTTAAQTTTTAAQTTTTTGSKNADKKFTVGRLQMDVPEGWTLLTDEGMYLFVPADYPTHADNLGVLATPADAFFGVITQDMMETQLSAVYPDITFHTFEKSTEDGADCLEMRYSASLNGIEMTFIQYMYNADQLYTVTYTLLGTDMADAVEVSANSISIVG